MACIASNETETRLVYTGKCEFYGALITCTPDTDDASVPDWDSRHNAHPSDGGMVAHRHCAMARDQWRVKMWRDERYRHRPPDPAAAARHSPAAASNPARRRSDPEMLKRRNSLISLLNTRRASINADWFLS